MDLGYRNRNDPAHQLQQDIVKSELVHQTTLAIHRLVQLYPDHFDLHFLPKQQTSVPVQDALAQLYSETVSLYRARNVVFDTHWHWNIAWRQALSYESLAELAGGNATTVINSFHPKSRKALQAIFKHDLARYMRWYPWRWFSDLVLVGAGGFSAVYAADVTLLYDVTETLPPSIGSRRRPVAIKVVDEKILNEIIVQSRAFLALLFHGITVCESTGDLLMIATLVQDGNLENRISAVQHQGLNMPMAADIVTRLAFNLASLHDEIGMCHRNIHPGNVLCADDDYFLIDFRFSTAANEAAKVTKSAMAHYGRLPYIAPEVRKGLFSEKSDIYALGVIMWQLVSGITFPSPEIILADPTVYRIEWIPGVPRWYLELAMACLEPRPENRPDAEEIGLIARKYAVSPHSPDMLVHHDDWTAYASRRRDEERSHRQRVSPSSPSRTPLDANSLLRVRSPPGNAGDENMTASRVYALRSLPSLENMINMPFHHRPFDAAVLSDDYS